MHRLSSIHTRPSGTCSYSNGDVYKGKWRSNQKHGDGSYLFHNGNMYRGEWAHDRACGTGTCVYSNGDKYTSHSLRVLLLPPVYFCNMLRRYAGSWFQDRAHGKGVYTYSSGELYDGDWVHGKKTGQGVQFPAKMQKPMKVSI